MIKENTKIAQLKTRLISPENRTSFILVTALFLFWGIPNNLNDILIRQFMKSFEISRLEAGLIFRRRDVLPLFLE